MGDAAYKKRHKEQGLCVDCNRPAIPGQIRCMVHARYHNETFPKYYAQNRDAITSRIKRNREQYIKDGRCQMCSAPLGEQDEGMTCCVNCRDRQMRMAIRNRQPISGAVLENYYKKVAEQS